MGSLQNLEPRLCTNSFGAKPASRAWAWGRECSYMLTFRDLRFLYFISHLRVFKVDVIRFTSSNSGLIYSKKRCVIIHVDSANVSSYSR